MYYELRSNNLFFPVQQREVLIFPILYLPIFTWYCLPGPLSSHSVVHPTSCGWGSPFHSWEWSMSKFPCSLTRNMTSHSKENLAFHSLLRGKMILIQILTTLCIFSLRGWENVLFELRSERVKWLHRRPLSIYLLCCIKIVSLQSLCLLTF